MRTFSKMILALGMVALLIAPAQAQQQKKGGGRGFGGPGGGGGMGAMLIANKGVQEHLKATDEQKSKLDALAETVRTKQSEQRDKLQDVPQEERQAKMREMGLATMADVRKGVSEILKPEQLKRFEQIQLQQMGILGAPEMPRIQEALKLTDEQKSKLRTIQEGQREAMSGLFGGGGGGDRQAAMQKMASVRRESNEKAMAVLTDSQRTSWNELIGEPFEVRFEGAPGGPGGPGGPRRKQQ